MIESQSIPNPNGFAVVALGMLAAASLFSSAQAQETIDKSVYHLFNPTPNELMRDLSPDRPDGTESPRTVDAGHFQIEMSFFDFTHDDDGGAHSDSWAIADTNLKVGLTNDIDLQVVFAAFAEERSDAYGGPTSTADGFGDVQLRLKINIFGNDPGPHTPQLFGRDTAFAVMPFFKIPTGTELSNGHGEGGVILAYGIDAADNWGIGLMAEFGAVYDETDDDYDGELVHTAVVGFDVVGPVGAYVEYIGVVSTDTDSDYQALFSTGLTYSLSPNTVLDVGTRIGLTTAADDFNFFTGITWRF